MSSLLAYRNYSGVGDWIMAMTVLKMVNQQFPDIDIHLNLLARNKFASVNCPIKIPPLAQEIVKGFDVNIKEFTYYSNPEMFSHNYNYTSGHMIYRKGDGKHFIRSMVEVFKENTKLNLSYDEGVYAQYEGEILPRFVYPPYVLMQSCSKKRCRTKDWKDYGFNNMSIIANRIKGFAHVVQVGADGDLILEDAVSHFLSVNLRTLHSLMSNAICFIGLDGALGVYAAHHSIKHYIIYHGDFNYEWTKFPNRLQIDGNKLEAEEVAENILERKLCTV